MAQPVPVVGDREPARFLGERFLALQGLELVVFGDLGGDDFEDVVREPAQCDRVVLGGAPDQVRLGVAAVLDRERVDTLDDHHRLLLGHVAGGHRVPDRLVVAVQRVRELEATFGVAFGLPGGVGPPGGGVGGAGLGAEVEVVGLVWRRRSSSSVSRCRSAATEARVSASSVCAHRPESGVPSWSRSAWNRATRAATGCASGSPNTVAIQGILARPPTSRAGNGAFRAAVEKYSRKSGSGALDVVVSTGWDRRGRWWVSRLTKANPPPGEQTRRPRSLPLPVAAPVDHPRSPTAAEPCRRLWC